MSSVENVEAGYAVYVPRQYQARLAISLVIILLGVFALASGLFSLLFAEKIKWAHLIAGPLALWLGGEGARHLMNTMLVIDPDGLTYHTARYTIFVRWPDVKRVEFRLRRQLQYVLAVGTFTVKEGSLRVRAKLQQKQGKLVIPVEEFVYKWESEELFGLIRRYAPRITVPR